MRLAAAIAIAAAAVTHGAAKPRTLPRATPALPRTLSISGGDSAPEPLSLTLDIRAEPLGKAIPGPMSALAWHESGEAWIGSAAGTSWSARIGLTPGDDGVALDVEIAWREAVHVDVEAIRLRIPGHATAVGRDLAVHPVNAISRVDRGTPIFVSGSSMAVAGGEGFVAARAVASLKGTPFTDVELILDDAAAHPFSTFDECVSHLPRKHAVNPTNGTLVLTTSAQPVGSPGEEDANAPVDWQLLEKKTAQDRITRAAGEIVRAHATILLPSAPAVPLIIERWPAGRRGAFVITDHADRTSAAALRAILYGTSDEKSRLYGKQGFFAHGLPITKTFFAGNRGGTLSGDPAARALADELIAHGSEVGSHGITSVPDSRETVRKGLAVFDPWHVSTWIDHEPYTNCEALSSSGWKTTPPWGIRDLLAAHGYRWVWAATDLGGFKDSRITNLYGGKPEAAAPAIFPFPPDPKLMTFQSVWFFSTAENLGKGISNPALSALEDARGLFVAHTYLSPSLDTTKSESHKKMLAVRVAKNGSLEIEPDLEKALARLESHVKSGALWMAPWQEVGDRLVAIGNVDVSYRHDGTAVVTNRGPTAITGLTLAIPADAEISVDGSALSPSSVRRDAGRTTAWIDLAPGASVTVAATAGGRQLMLAPSKRAKISQR